MRALNRDWRGKDKPTNVLSFPAPPPPGAPGPRHLGDIVLAYETLAREAAAEGKALADHAAHLVVHGVLHLLGYDHEAEAEAEHGGSGGQGPGRASASPTPIVIWQLDRRRTVELD